MDTEAQANRLMWGIHNDQSSIDPVADSAVRIGWDETGDLSTVAASRDAFKELLTVKMPEIGPNAIPGTAGTLYRFVHDLGVGDVIVSPNRSKRTLNIGCVSGEYEFRPDAPLYRHWRPVEWLRVNVPRDELSVAAQNEISALTTLFKIVTGREEVEQLIAQPTATSKGDFTWTRFYADLADKLLDFATDRSTLLEKVWSVAERSGVPHLFKYLKGDHRRDGSYGPLRDVDPFTVLASFNRGIKDDARAAIAAAFADEFGVTSKPPTQFSGIPTANNLKSWFIRFEVDRGSSDIDALWHLATAAVDYAEMADEATQDALVNAFDECAIGNTRLLTMGLYWMRPATFAAYDSVNALFIKKEFPHLAERLSLGVKISGDQFVSNTEAIHEWLQSADTDFSSTWDLSYAAFLDSLKISPQPDTAVPDSTTDAPLAVQAETADEAGDPYDAGSIREDGCFLTEEELLPILERLASKKNLILQGPPGTGKTWLARRLGWALCGERDTSRVQILQFHPSLAYEDFVRGWRPSATAGGSLSLEDGPFLQMCQQAAQDPEHDYVLVIEEINRGNPAQVLGELLTLIEADKRSPSSAMRLAYPRTPDERFFVPSNLHLIGTMNLADRSLAMVDMALRRRFAFIELRPRLGADWVEYVSQLGYDPKLLEVYGQRVDALNEQIAQDGALGRQYCVGHSYFTPARTLEANSLGTQEWWRRVVETDVRPLLEEYWFDQSNLAAEACDQLLGT